MGQLIFVTGPVRSGKSRWAVARARAWGDGVVFVATCRPDPGDAEMAARLARHRAERPAPWRTLEAPADPAAATAALAPPPAGVVLDCLTLWLSDRLHLDDDAILAAWDAQLAAFEAAPWPTVIVGNEVGWSPVPLEPELRRFRDLAGWLAQASAAASDEAWLLVAGCPLRLR
jgi:adenosyl cobinamide kinase/adenosyl cobinamide phosphate guanylyltransferase